MRVRAVLGATVGVAILLAANTQRSLHRVPDAALFPGTVRRARSPSDNQTYYGEENWDLLPLPAKLPDLDPNGCFSAFEQQGYTIISTCSKPTNVRPQTGEVLRVSETCVFVPETVCCTNADGLVWDLRTQTHLRYRKNHLSKLRRQNPKQIWIAESTETYQTMGGMRPIGKAALLKYMDYAAYWGSDDFPLLPNYDHRNKVNRDLLVWPGRHVRFQTAEPLSSLLERKQAGILYLSSDCASSHGSDRDSFVKSFMTYLRVESLGSCLTTGTWDRHGSSTDFRNASAALIAKHRFRLVLPNSICDDYVAEKFSQTLLHATIPIFLGAPTGKKYDPGLAARVHPGAIHVVDFPGFAELAAHILYIVKNESAYLRYFEWVGQTAEAWPSHYDEILKRRQGATSVLQYACERTQDGIRPAGGADTPTNCHGSWKRYFFNELMKNRSRWQDSVHESVAVG
jgi:hypothetical protein